MVQNGTKSVLVIFQILLSIFTFVEGLQVANGRRDGRIVGKLVAEVSDEHAELGAPVADVVESEDVVADELEQAADAVADDCRAQVADVHLLGDVWRGEVDHGSLLVAADKGRTHATVGHDLAQLGAHKLLGQVDVDEARSADLALGNDLVGRQAGHNSLRHLVRVHLLAFAFQQLIVEQQQQQQQRQENNSTMNF